jgi:hypothetical protein
LLEIIVTTDLRIMTQADKREKAMQDIAEMLRRNTFNMELQVKQKPRGIRIIYEVTQEELDAAIENQNRRNKHGC